MNEYLFHLVDVVAPALDLDWKKMYELMNQMLRFHKKNSRKISYQKFKHILKN